MGTPVTPVVGIDVSKATLDACLLADSDGKAPDFGIWGVGVLDGGKVYAYDPRSGTRRDAFYGFPTDFTGGVYVG